MSVEKPEDGVAGKRRGDDPVGRDHGSDNSQEPARADRSRQQRLREIQKRLQSGTYRIPAEQIAPALLEAFAAGDQSPLQPCRKISSPEGNQPEGSDEQ